MEPSERYRRSETCHSSCVSTSTAPASRSSDAGLGNTPTTSARRLISLLRRSVAEHALDPGELPAEHAGDQVELGVHVFGVGLGEDGANGGGDHLAVAAGHPGQHVAHEMDL
jgi:hypothetical protein